MSKIKNIIFDIGRVIFPFTRNEIVKDHYHGSEENVQLIADILFKDWWKTDEGTISYEDFLQSVLDNLPKEFHEYIPKMIKGWVYNRKYVDGVLDFVKELKNQGYKLYILSNMPAYFLDARGGYEIFKYFDGEVYSAPIKMVKPNREIYDYLLNKYNLVPSECMFIDDLLPNVEAARKLGIHAIQFENDYTKVREYLNKLNK